VDEAKIASRRSGAEAVYAVLRDQIIEGLLPPGDRLPENDLARAMGVSRTPIREALHLLLGEQLVERRVTGGFHVAPLRESDVRQIYELRARLEGLLARDACERLTDADLVALRERIDQMSLLRDHEDEVVRIGQEFHHIIARVADNRWCVSVLQQIRGHVDRFRALSTSAPGRPTDAVAEHTAIYDALAARDPDGAESVMREHVNRGAEATLRALRARQHGDRTPPSEESSQPTAV
jgi:DNA-binding GntR family transcriptional regulator